MKFSRFIKKDSLNQINYYVGGMEQPERKWKIGSGFYRYGFNGKENDNEVKGNGNQQDYGMRIYDTRLGRFLSVDPITKSYPWLTPYQFASNIPIDGIDLYGQIIKYFSSPATGELRKVAFKAKMELYYNDYQSKGFSSFQSFYIKYFPQ